MAGAAGRLKVEDAKAWCNTRGDRGKKASSLIGKLSGMSNVQAHALAEQLIVELGLLANDRADGQGSDDLEEDGSDASTVFSIGDKIARLETHVAGHPKDRAAMKRLEHLKGAHDSMPSAGCDNSQTLKHIIVSQAWLLLRL